MTKDNIDIIINKIKKAKKHYEKGQELQNEIASLLSNNYNIEKTIGLGVDAGDIIEMIDCYLMYNDDSLNNIKKEIKRLVKEVNND